MAQGMFAGYIEGIMQATPINLSSSNVNACLYGDAAANAPSAANLNDDSIDTLANLNTATSGDVEDKTGTGTGAHVVTVGNKLFGDAGMGAGPNIFDINEVSTMTTATNSVETKDLLLIIAVTMDQVATSDNPLLCYFDLAAPPTPNGQDVNITWNANGVFRFAPTP